MKTKTGQIAIITLKNGGCFRGNVCERNAMGLYRVERCDNHIGGWYYSRQIRVTYC